MSKDKEVAKNVDLEQYLQSIGCKMKGRNSGRYATFSSPLRSSSVPAFQVDRSKNRFVDYSGGGYNRGDIIDFVMQYENCDMNTAIKTILSNYSKVVIDQFVPKQIKSDGVLIHSVGDLEDFYLLRYARDRKVNTNVLKSVCKQISVSFPNGKNPDKEYKLIGFKTDLGGYEYRSEYIKGGTSNKSITTIKGKDSSQVVIFEGFFSYISALTYFKTFSFKGDVIVLNSLSYLNQVIESIGNYDKVNLCLDYGKAGDKAVLKTLDKCPNAIDMREWFKGYEDANDLLTGKKLKVDTV